MNRVTTNHIFSGPPIDDCVAFSRCGPLHLSWSTTFGFSCCPSVSESPGDALAHEEMQFTVETLDVFPGKAVRPGDSLCHLAYHTVLYIEGQAFENEIEAIGKLRQNGWTANLEFGTHGHETVTKGAQILYLDNHVDPDSQTFRFYVRLENETLQETRDEQGKLYRSWKYKPGQRVHVVIPVKKNGNAK